MSENIVCPKCGLENSYFTKQLGPHQGAFCNSCHSWIKHIPYSPDIRIHFGRFKGTLLKEFTTPDQIKWLRWAHDNATSISTKLRSEIAKQLGI